MTNPQIDPFAPAARRRPPGGPGALRGAAAAAGPALAVDPRALGRGADDRRGALAGGRRAARRFPDAGLRGALPLPAPAPAAAARPARLRDLAGDRTRGRRLLPRPAAGRHREPWAPAPPPRRAARRLGAPADREAARAAPPARPYPRADRRSTPRPPGSLRHHGSGARPRARPGHPALRLRSPPRPLRDQERLPAAVRRGGGRASARRGEPALARRSGRGARPPAPPAAGDGEGDRQAERRRLRRRQRLGRSRRAARSGRSRRSRGAARAARGDALRARDRDPRGLPGEARGARRHRRGAPRWRGVPQPERPAAHHAARRGRAPVDPRPAARGPQRAGLSRLPVPGGPGVRGHDRRARR